MKQSVKESLERNDKGKENCKVKGKDQGKIKGKDKMMFSSLLGVWIRSAD